MNPKIFMAFAGGVVLASAVAYFAAQGPSASKDVPVPPAQTATAPEPEPPPVADNTPQKPEPETEREPEPVRRSPVQRAVVTRPAPVPAPAPVPVRQPDPAPAAVTLPPPTPAPPPPAAVVTEPPRPAPEPVRPPEPPKPNSVTIPAGTLINVRVQEKLSSETNTAGDSFQATLDQPVVVDGFVIAEKGARVEGRIAELDRAGKVKGVARMVLELSRMNTSDGQRVDIRTASFESKAETSKKKDAAKVGIGAAIGAAIGAIAGGGKGAAVGAGAGGAAGAGGVLLTRGNEAEIPVETRLSFRLQDSVTLTERLNH